MRRPSCNQTAGLIPAEGSFEKTVPLRNHMTGGVSSQRRDRHVIGRGVREGQSAGRPGRRIGREEERVMCAGSDKRPGRGEIGCESREDVGRNGKWGWPTGTRVICSVLTECGFGSETLHGSGSQTQVKNQKQTQAAINEILLVKTHNRGHSSPFPHLNAIFPGFNGFRSFK